MNLYIAIDLDNRWMNQAIADLQRRHQSFKNWCNGRDGAEVLFELLSKQYELAKMDEAKDGASIQVLDAAIEPERKSKPKRALLLMLAAVGGFFLACILAFVLEALRKSKENPEGRERWNALKAAWQGK